MVGEGVVLIGDVWFVKECGATVVGEGVVLICNVWLVEECGGTVVRRVLYAIFLSITKGMCC